MQLGLMTKHLHQQTIEEVAAAVAGFGLSSVQLDLTSAGLPEQPETVDAAFAARIRDAFARHGIVIAALSGTFNMIDPEPARLQTSIAAYPILLDWCRALDCTVVTACTGTRNPRSMWRHHPDNALPQAWADLRRTLDQVLPAAEARGVTIAFEPEVVNVIDTAEKAQRLIAEVQSPHLRLVMDPANYFQPSMLIDMDAVLNDIFQRVGGYIVFAHAKDVRPPEPGGTECVRPAAGTGMLNYALYLDLLRQSGYDGALVMHSLEEAEVPASAAYVRRFM
ncbi:MAG TPA: sugar phosphate isomerase/epimerase [Chloroflexota bacterium]|nr:sugar phosphate isomerase/epimerase [Chloroflexota bacterium]